MIESDYPSFRHALRDLVKVFPKELEDETLKLYWYALRDLSYDAFDHGCNQAMRYHKRFPYPGDLRDYAQTYVRPQRAQPAERLLRSPEQDAMNIGEVRALLASLPMFAHAMPVIRDRENEDGSLVYHSGRSASQEVERKKIGIQNTISQYP